MRILEAAWFDASAAFAVFIAGMLLIYLELARPGLIVAGAAGAVLAMTAAVRLRAMEVSPAALLLLSVAVVLLFMEIYARWPGVPGAASGLALTFAAAHWGNTPGERVKWWIAAPLAFGYCAVTVIAGSAAWRGFWAKRNW